MNDKYLHGQGSTPERKRQSTIKVAPRIITQRGMTASYGEHDTEHCGLDYLLNKGFIEKHHYDAGCRLRGIFYTFNKTGIPMDDMGTRKAYEGDHETAADKAEMRFLHAMRAVSHENKNLVRYACIEADGYIPAHYRIMMTITLGLQELHDHFQDERKK